MAAKYIIIDKNIVVNGSSFEFDIYHPSESKKYMNNFIEKGVLVRLNDEVLKNKEALYISEEDKDPYELAYKAYLNLQNNKEDTTKDIVEDIEENIRIDEKSIEVYTKATMVLDKLFKNPHTLGNYEDSKEVVSDLVNTILDDKFTIKSLMSIATHDYYTHTHSLNVAVYALSLGKFLGLTKETLAELGESALLHDLGKSKVSAKIINKNGKLTDAEFRIMKGHPRSGYILGLSIGIKNENILFGIKYHHEKMDGTGYPDGLIGKDIPFFARIIGICDIFDALTSKRSYKAAMSSFNTLKLMKLKMNTQVDLNLLNKMIMMFR